MNEFANDYILFKVDEEQIGRFEDKSNIDFWKTIHKLAERWNCEVVKEQDGYRLKNDPNQWGACGVCLIHLFDIQGCVRCFTEALYYERGKYSCDHLKEYCEYRGLAYEQ